MNLVFILEIFLGILMFGNVVKSMHLPREQGKKVHIPSVTRSKSLGPPFNWIPLKDGTILFKRNGKLFRHRPTHTKSTTTVRRVLPSSGTTQLKPAQPHISNNVRPLNKVKSLPQKQVKSLLRNQIKSLLQNIVQSNSRNQVKSKSRPKKIVQSVTETEVSSTSQNIFQSLPRNKVMSLPQNQVKVLTQNTVKSLPHNFKSLSQNKIKFLPQNKIKELPKNSITQPSTDNKIFHGEKTSSPKNAEKENFIVGLGNPMQQNSQTKESQVHHFVSNNPKLPRLTSFKDPKQGRLTSFMDTKQRRLGSLPNTISDSSPSKIGGVHLNHLTFSSGNPDATSNREHFPNKSVTVKELLSSPTGNKLSDDVRDLLTMTGSPTTNSNVKHFPGNVEKGQLSKNKSPSMTGSHKSPSMTGSHQSTSMTGSQQSPSMTGSHQSPSMTGIHQSPSMSGSHQSPSMTGRHQSPSVDGRHQSSSIPASGLTTSKVSNSINLADPMSYTIANANNFPMNLQQIILLDRTAVQQSGSAGSNPAHNTQQLFPFYVSNSALSAGQPAFSFGPNPILSAEQPLLIYGSNPTLRTDKPSSPPRSNSLLDLTILPDAPIFPDSLMKTLNTDAGVHKGGIKTPDFVWGNPSQNKVNSKGKVSPVDVWGSQGNRATVTEQINKQESIGNQPNGNSGKKKSPVDFWGSQSNTATATEQKNKQETIGNQRNGKNDNIAVKKGKHSNRNISSNKKQNSGGPTTEMTEMQEQLASEIMSFLS